MRRLIRWILNWIEGCMEGRYGIDGLSVLYLCICAALVGCASVMAQGTGRIVTYIGAFVLGGYAIYRCFSKDTEKQNRQWLSFQNEIEEIDYRISLHTGVWKIRRAYRYIRCKKCGHRFRVPRKRGKEEILCPNCGNHPGNHALFLIRR